MKGNLFSKVRTPLCATMISVGLLILVWQGVEHYLAARRGPLVAFDDAGEPVGWQYLGVACLGGGIFLLVLTSGKRGEPPKANR